MGNKGRPRKTGVKRTKSGRISQAAGDYAENLDPIQTRMRLYGLSEKDARDQKAATYIGRLYLTGELGKRPHSDAMWDAAQEYLRVYEAFQRAVKSPDALRSGAGGGDQGESDNYAGWCQSAIERHENAVKAVRREQELHRGANMWAALDYIIVRNEQHPYMVGDARLALNCLAHHFGLMGKARRGVDSTPQIAA